MPPVSVEAFEAAADPDRYPGPGSRGSRKLYYHVSFHLERFEALPKCSRRGMESPYADWLKRWEKRRHAAPGDHYAFACGDYFEVRDRALLAHATQIDPNGRWFAVPDDIQREVWPTEDYRPGAVLVDTELPEDDLFAGIRDKV